MDKTTSHSQGAEHRVDPPFSGPLASFEAWLYDLLYKKISYKLPTSLREVLVQYGPWVTLVVALLSLPAIFIIFGAGAVVSVYGALAGVSYSPLFYVAILVLIVQVVLMFMAVSPLLKRRRLGWQLVFYASTISVLYSVFNSFSYGYFSFFGLLWGLIGATVSYYVIFQIRSYYKS